MVWYGCLALLVWWICRSTTQQHKQIFENRSRNLITRSNLKRVQWKTLKRKNKDGSTSVTIEPNLSANTVENPSPVVQAILNSTSPSNTNTNSNDTTTGKPSASANPQQSAFVSTVQLLQGLSQTANDAAQATLSASKLASYCESALNMVKNACHAITLSMFAPAVTSASAASLSANTLMSTTGNLIAHSLDGDHPLLPGISSKDVALTAGTMGVFASSLQSWFRFAEQSANQYDTAMQFMQICHEIQIKLQTMTENDPTLHAFYQQVQAEFQNVLSGNSPVVSP